MRKNNLLIIFLSVSLFLGSFLGYYLFSFYKGSFLSSLFTEISASEAIDLSLDTFNKDDEQTDFQLKAVVATKRNIEKVLSSKQIQNRLKTLSMEGADLNNLENSIGYLANIMYLSLIDCSTGHQPQSIYDLTSLRYLEIGNCSLKTIDSKISNLSLLTTLKLYKNNISSVPNELMSLTNLEHIDIRDNNLSAVPEIFYQMDNLKEVFLEGNKIDKAEINAFQEYLKNKNTKNNANSSTE